MCGPLAIPIATAALSAVGAVASYRQQSQQAEAQAKAANEVQRQARLNATRQYTDLQLRQQQERMAAAQQKEQSQREARATVASARTAAGESGVTGFSVDSVIGDIEGRAARYRENINQNQEFTQQQLQATAEGIRAGAQSQINQAASTNIQGPSMAGLGLGLATAGLQGYQDYTQARDLFKERGRKGV